jgi:hypothetical protein
MGKSIPIKNFWRNFLKFCQKHRWLLISAIAIFSLVLGFIGFRKYFNNLGETRSLFDIFYLAIQLFTLESGSVSGLVNWELEVARLLAPAIAAYAAIKALALIFQEQLQAFRMKFIRDHVVICGLGRRGVLLVEKFREAGNRVAAIELDEGNGFLNQCKDQGALVFVGNAADRELLRKARIHKAKYLISVCGDDGVNAEVAVRSRELVGDRERKVVTSIVHISDPQLCHLLREQEIETGKLDAFRLEFFNVYDSGARAWLKDFPLFGEADDPRSSRPHLLVVGVGKLGESLIVQTVKKWRTLFPEGGEKICITLVDIKAESIKELLYLRYPQLEKACDLAALQMDVESSDFQHADFLYESLEKCGVTNIFICLDNDSLSLSTALKLLQQIKKLKVSVVARMAREAGLATLLRGEDQDDGSIAVIHTFGLLDRTCQPEEVLAGTNELIAQAVHKDYLHRQKKKGETPETNPSMVKWEELPEELKESNRQQADHIGEKLKEMSCGIIPLTDWDEKLFEFTDAELEIMAKMEHDRYIFEREQKTWKKGPKNIQKKKTPSLIPWEDMSPEMKGESREPARNLPFYLAEVGFKIIRLKERRNE